MKQQTWIAGLIAVAWFAGVAYGAAPGGSANVGQTDLQNWPCPVSASPTFVAMPVGVSLTTTGGPVLMSLIVSSMPVASGADILASLTADAHSVSPDVGWRASSAELGTITRVVSVSAGAHTFGAQVACISDEAFTIPHAWLTVYELPLIKK